MNSGLQNVPASDELIASAGNQRRCNHVGAFLFGQTESLSCGSSSHYLPPKLNMPDDSNDVWDIFSGMINWNSLFLWHFSAFANQWHHYFMFSPKSFLFEFNSKFFSVKTESKRIGSLKETFSYYPHNFVINSLAVSSFVLVSWRWRCMYWHNCFIVSTNPSHKCRSSMRRFFFTAVKKIAFVSLLFPATLYVALLTCPVTSYVGNPFLSLQGSVSIV